MRPATLDDVEAVLDLVSRLNLADYDEPMISSDSLRRVWQSPTFSLAADTWLVTPPDETLVGYAQLQCEEGTRFYLAVHVEKAYRGQGIGMALLLHSLGEFYRRGTRRVKLSVDSHSLAHAPRLYRRAGMQTIQQYHVYRKELRFDVTMKQSGPRGPGTVET